ncbi:MAG: hypothetical protein R3E01_03890 [Pirellulaceae bacterium]|nr:hypothetical protein [Planctomycetales bacterium]
MNTLFRNDPVAFCDKYTIDNTAWARTRDGAGSVSRLNQMKECLVDFKPVSGNTVTFQADTVAMGGSVSVGSEPLIRAYWCPFLAGTQEIGHVDVSKAKPAYEFVFTAAMQGCWFVVTDAGTDFRVHHHQQHPADKTAWKNLNAPQDSTISTLEYTEYGDRDNAESMINAFNFLIRTDGRWNYVAQTQRLVPAAMTFGVERDLGRPILVKNAGV